VSYYRIGIFLIVRPSRYEILLIRWRSACYDDWRTSPCILLSDQTSTGRFHPPANSKWIKPASMYHLLYLGFLGMLAYFFKNPKLLHPNRPGIHKLHMMDNRTYSRIRELENGLYSPEPSSHRSYLGSICLPIELEISS
jgi:hypothetical protein